MQISRQLITVASLTLMGLMCGLPSPAHAQSRIHPAVFALPSSYFPTGSRLMRSGVETNRQLQNDDAAHFGLPPGAIGRVTGYYMNAHEEDPLGNQLGYTSYLVSIFASAHQAKAAYSDRWDIWFDANYHSTPVPLDLAVGDYNAAAIFHSVSPPPNYLTELFFRRGAILVEVFQGDNTVILNPERRQTLYSIATALDTLAEAHRRGL
jgi:hypothetical protein